jgi:hypothetical protein
VREEAARIGAECILGLCVVLAGSVVIFPWVSDGSVPEKLLGTGVMALGTLILMHAGITADRSYGGLPNQGETKKNGLNWLITVLYAIAASPWVFRDLPPVVEDIIIPVAVDVYACINCVPIYLLALRRRREAISEGRYVPGVGLIASGGDQTGGHNSRETR